MGEQDDKIFYYALKDVGTANVRYGLKVRWDVLLSIAVERGVQAYMLGSMLALVVWYAQSKGGLC